MCVDSRSNRAICQPNSFRLKAEQQSRTDKEDLSRGAPLWILMIDDLGVIVALGSDFNPNAYCLAMPMIMHLGEDLKKHTNIRAFQILNPLKMFFQRACTCD